MVKKSIYTLILLILLAGLYGAPGVSSALDAPHNNVNGVICDTCHYPSTAPPVWATAPTPAGSTPLNELCMDCHNSIDGAVTNPKFADVKTHSSYETDPTATGPDIYLMECRTCHNPHWQDQMRANPLLGDLASGVTTSIQASSLTDAAKNWAIDQFKDALLLPNAAYTAYSYRIVANTTNTLTVAGPMKTTAPFAGVGKPYSIKYGKMIKGTISTPNSGARAVTFLNNQGLYSFATSTVMVDGICQVCHTKTVSYTNTGTLEGPGHPSLKTGTDCTICHQHASGFKANCGACHGNPPLVSTPGGPDGLAGSEGGTGSLTPGAHSKHAVTQGYVCDTCHTGGMPASTVYDKKIQIGFSIAGGAYQSGSYNGRASLANGYTYTRGNPGTIVTTGGTKVCSNVYCHGNTMAPNGGTDTTPIWDSPSTASCGTCHGATATVPPTKGSHYKHARTNLLGYAYPCGSCHKDPSVDISQHVNNRSEVLFSSDPKTAGGGYYGTGNMLDAYGTCTNVYCHSTVQSSPPGSALVYRVTPTWGNNDTLGCSGCHEYSPALASGSHAKHFEYPELQQCYQCHNWSNSNDPCMSCHDEATIEPRRDKHANRSVDIAFAPKYGGSYSGTAAPGDAYGSCSNTYCHSTGVSVATATVPVNTTPGWGFSGPLLCTACHGNETGNDGTGRPGYANGSPKANSHWSPSHVGSSCSACHYATTTTGTTITDKTEHVNNAYDVMPNLSSGITFTYTYAPSGGTCTTVSCHAGGATRTWGL